MDLSMEPHLVSHGEYPHLVAHNGPVCSPPLPSPSPSTTSSSSQAQVANANPSMTRQQSLPQQLNCGQGAGGNMPAFQPFFFTSTFPVNVQGKDGRHTALAVDVVLLMLCDVCLSLMLWCSSIDFSQQQSFFGANPIAC